MTDVLPRLGPMDDKHHSGGFDEQRFQNEGLKGSLVVVEANAVGVCFIDLETDQKECDLGPVARFLHL